MDNSAQNIGENQITPQIQQAVAPDTTNQQGQTQLLQKVQQANQAKPYLTTVLQAIADKIGADQSIRVKQIQTMGQKIAQKRLQGRSDYTAQDMTDILGGRIIVDNKKDIPKAISAIKEAAKKGAFAIDKKEDASRGTYKATHFDVILPQGVAAEIQVHDVKSQLEAISNHQLRADHGEDPKNDAVIRLRDLQAKKVQNLPINKAKAVTQAMKQIEQQQGNILPLQSAALLSHANNV